MHDNSSKDTSSNTTISLQRQLVYYVSMSNATLTVHSRYLGLEKPLGGFNHYINIGSFFLMLLDKYGIKLYIRDVIFNQSVWCRG